MSGLVIHQLVHGYEHGHSLLAASTELGRGDLDLVGRLSDLSGALGPELEISSYLSLYPLPSRSFFAVARTWPDESAPRSGCVLTHTLLVPLEAWAGDDSPNRFAAALRTPGRDTLADYSVPIRSVPAGSGKVVASEPLGDSFIQRYFGEGLAPIVWFGARDPEAAAWCVIQALWPSLRARFACCTLALQPRTLGDRPFDLVFAPPAVFSRFGEFARDHIVDGRAPSNAVAETWFRSWSSCVFEGNPTEICKRAHVLSSDLEPYPTAIRSVLFFLELKERAGESPTAALGALDLLEKLAPQPSRAQEEKCALAGAAMRSIKGLPPGEARELLYLLCRRLQEHSFAPGQDLQVEIRNLVQRLIRDDPDQGIKDANSLTARHAEAAPTLFMLGVGDAVMGLLESDSVKGSLLIEQPGLMESLVPYRPEIPATILRSSGPIDRERIISSIVDWCRAEQASGVRPALRRSLLPEVMKPGDAPLVEELLRDLGADEVAEVCDVVESRDAFRSGPLSGVVDRLVGERQPSSVRQWSRTHSWNSYQAATVIAASYASTADGLSEFFSTEIPDSANQSLLLAAFIERASAFSPPSWLLSLLKTDLRCWELLLTGIKDQAVGDVVINLVRGGLRRSPIARVPHAARLLGGVSGRDSNTVKEYAIRQLLADYFEESCDIGRVKLWFEESWVIEALTHIRADSVRAIFADQLRRSSSSWPRAWNVVENIPEAVVFKNEELVQEIISVLLQTDSKQWTVAVADSWRQLLSKISWGDRVQIDLCGQALHFALEHRRLPLAGVVAETFYPVHEAAMEHRVQRGSRFPWVFGNWDKAKDLRRSLVDSFIHSDWERSHFALSAREPWLLRKLCKRMLRQWQGSQYLESAYTGLTQISSSKAQKLASVLHQILQNPDFAEDWD
jgi:hypothetical protein